MAGAREPAGLALLALLAACAGGGDPGPETAGGASVTSETPAAPVAAELLRQADQRFSAREYAAAREAYQGCAAAAAAEGARSVEVEARAQVARCWSLPSGPGTPDLTRAREELGRAAGLASPEDPPGWSRLLGVRGILEREGGDRPRALATFVEMHDYCRARGLPRRAIDAAHHAAIVAPPGDQEAWARKGIAAAEACQPPETGWLAVLWNNLGATYEDLARYPEAVAAYRKAREYHHLGKAEQPRLAADWALGHALRLAGELDEAETWLAGALAWAERRHAAAPDAGTEEWLGYCLQDTGELQVARGQRAEGLATLRTARARLAAAGLESHWPEHLQKLDARIAALEQAD